MSIALEMLDQAPNRGTPHGVRVPARHRPQSPPERELNSRGPAVPPGEPGLSTDTDVRGESSSPPRRPPRPLGHRTSHHLAVQLTAGRRGAVRRDPMTMAGGGRAPLVARVSRRPRPQTSYARNSRASVRPWRTV